MIRHRAYLGALKYYFQLGVLTALEPTGPDVPLTGAQARAAWARAKALAADYAFHAKTRNLTHVSLEVW